MILPELLTRTRKPSSICGPFYDVLPFPMTLRPLPLWCWCSSSSPWLSLQELSLCRLVLRPLLSPILVSAARLISFLTPQAILESDLGVLVCPSCPWCLVFPPSPHSPALPGCSVPPNCCSLCLECALCPIPVLSAPQGLAQASFAQESCPPSPHARPALPACSQTPGFSSAASAPLSLKGCVAAMNLSPVQS